THTRVHGHVVHALLGLLDDRVAEDLPGQILGHTTHLFQRLVDRHGADRNWGVAQDPFAGGVDVVTGGQVHHGVRTPTGGPAQLVHLLSDGAGDRGVADIGVDLGEELVTNDHRFGFRVVDVVRDDRPAGGHRRAHLLDVAVLTQCDELHLAGDLAATGVCHLGDALALLGAQRGSLLAAPLLAGCAALGCPGAVV